MLLLERLAKCNMQNADPTERGQTSSRVFVQFWSPGSEGKPRIRGKLKSLYPAAGARDERKKATQVLTPSEGRKKGRKEMNDDCPRKLMSDVTERPEEKFHRSGATEPRMQVCNGRSFLLQLPVGGGRDDKNSIWLGHQTLQLQIQQLLGTDGRSGRGRGATLRRMGGRVERRAGSMEDFKNPLLAAAAGWRRMPA